MQAIYVLFRDDGALKLPYCIAIAGFVCAIFAFAVPHLSALRVWLGISTLFSLAYIIIALVLSLKDGIYSCNSVPIALKCPNSPDRNIQRLTGENFENNSFGLALRTCGIHLLVIQTIYIVMWFMCSHDLQRDR